MWQIIELGQISMSYIRFFSITQLVADGILIMIIFTSLILVHIHTNWYYYVCNKVSAKKIDINKIMLIILPIVVSVAGFLILWVIFFYIIKYTDTLLAYLASLLIYWGVLFCIFNILSKFPFVEYIQLINMIVPALFVLFITIILFSDKFSIPTNLKNTQYLNLPKNESVKYFNDKYIFIEQMIKKNKIKKY